MVVVCDDCRQTKLVKLEVIEKRLLKREIKINKLEKKLKD